MHPYIRVSDCEPILKYKDYYYGTQRHNFRYATTVDEALEMEGEPSPKCDLKKLLKVFPFELFPNAKDTYK